MKKKKTRKETMHQLPLSKLGTSKLHARTRIQCEEVEEKSFDSDYDRFLND